MPSCRRTKELLKLKKKLREIQKIEDSTRERPRDLSLSLSLSKWRQDAMAAGETVEPLQAEKVNKKAKRRSTSSRFWLSLRERRRRTWMSSASLSPSNQVAEPSDLPRAYLRAGELG